MSGERQLLMPRRPAAAGRRPDIEKGLTDKGFTWEYRTRVNTSDFDIEKSLRNQARLGETIDPDTVARYEAALTNGDLFPAVVASKDNRGKLVTVDGNHRLQAHINRKQPIDTYVISGNPQAIVMETFEANTRHGLPTSADERLHHALWLIDNGMTVPEAAQKLGLAKAQVQRAAGAAEGTRRADELGIVRTDWE